MNKKFKFLIILILSIAYTHKTYAVELPSSADPGRILKEKKFKSKKRKKTAKPNLKFKQTEPKDAPQESKDIFFTLNSVTIEGMSIYQPLFFQKLYQDKIGKQVSASFLWELANSISKSYKQDGYFLSRAFVPEQTIKTGDIRISVIEGHISDVDFVGKKDHIILDILSKILEQKPITAQNLESQLIRLNDLYGMKFKAILTKSKIAVDNGVTLKLEQDKTRAPQVVFALNNSGSRFIGPYRVGLSYEDSLINYHKTVLSTQANLPNGKELLSGSISHNKQITSTAEIKLLISKNKSTPGYTLKEQDIRSNSFSWRIEGMYQPIRQRSKNLKLSIHLDGINSNSNAFNTPLTRDKIRALRFETNFDFLDRFKGFNIFSITASRGIGIFGASNQGDANLSRAAGNPHFTKIEPFYNRQYYLGNKFSLNTSFAGQWSASSQLSSEEFGYGGQSFGRAYDSSEITGDHGASLSLEINYLGLTPYRNYQNNPFIYYDIGKVWNKKTVTIKQISASSAGFGTRIYGDNLGFDVVLAFPLTKSINNPLQGGNGKNLVLRAGLTYKLKLVK